MPNLLDTSGHPVSSLFPGILYFAPYLGLLLLLGYTVICAILGSQRRHWLELLGICFAAGAGSISLLLFWNSLLGHVPGRGFLALIAAVCLLTLFFLWRQKSLCVPSMPAPMEKLSPMSLLGFSGLILIAASVANIIYQSGWAGLTDIDSIAIWMFKAKIVALQPLCPIPGAFKQPSLSYSHQDYPLSLPFLIAGLYGLLGHLNDEQAKIILVPLYLSLVAIVYSAVRRCQTRTTSIALTAIFAASPTLSTNAAALVAETLLLMVLAAAAAMLLRWIETRQREDLMLAGLFSTFAAFTKNEGLALMPVIGLISLGIAVKARKASAIKDWSASAFLSVATLTPWLIYRTFLPRTHEDYGTKLTHASTLLNNLSRLGYILPQFARGALDASQVGLIWYLLVVITLIGYRGFIRPQILCLWILLLAQLTLYTGTFVVTPWDVHELLAMIGPKLLTQASPLAILLIAEHLRCTRWASENSGELPAFK